MKEKNYLQTGLKKIFFNPLCDHFFSEGHYVIIDYITYLMSYVTYV